MFTVGPDRIPNATREGILYISIEIHLENAKADRLCILALGTAQAPTEHRKDMLFVFGITELLGNEFLMLFY